MKKIAISAALVSSLLCGSAMAADVYTGTEESNPFEQGLNNFEGLSYDWSGFYLGVQGGYKSNDVKSFRDAENELYNIDMDKINGGIFAGYNYQLDNNIVIGIEGDVSSDNASETIKGIKESGKDYLINSSAEIKSKSNVSVRGRIGYAFDHVMPYVSAGITHANFSASGDKTCIGACPLVTTSTWEVKKGKTGYTVGAGLDMATMSNVVLRTEYRYTDFGKFNLGFKDDNKASSHEVRVGVAYKF